MLSFDGSQAVSSPRAATINNIELDKPFNSPNAASPSIHVYRNAENLKDVDNPVDRQIGFLYDDDNDEYLVGMAAGLSLVSGDTVITKRNQWIIDKCDVVIGYTIRDYGGAYKAIDYAKKKGKEIIIIE